MTIDDINREVAKLLLIKIGQNRIINQSKAVLEKQIKMESVNEIKTNQKKYEKLD